jgi:hypothetical protein
MEKVEGTLKGGGPNEADPAAASIDVRQGWADTVTPNKRICPKGRVLTATS